MPALLRSRLAPREMVDKACRDYFKLLADHPQVFLLLVELRTGDDPLRDGRMRIATTLSRVMVDALRAVGADASAAEPWAHGIVGFGLAEGEWWLRRRTISRRAAAAHLADFIWHAFAGVTAASGHGIEPVPELRVVEAGTEARA